MRSREELCGVVGSGPAGLAVARVLVEQGRKVVLFDPGMTLEPEIAAEVERAAGLAPQEWDEELRRTLKGVVSASPRGVEDKRLFGSDFVYRSLPGFPVEAEGCRYYESFAKGGLANIWGTAVLPMRQQDMGRWPFGLDALEDHYRGVLEYMPLSIGEHDAGDAVGELYPLYTATPDRFKPSRQAACFVNAVGRRRGVLERRGVYVGSSRIAVSTRTHAGRERCVYCGHCLHGCPYGLPYSGLQCLDELSRSELFSHITGIMVQSLQEEGNKVAVSLSDLEGAAVPPWRVDRVFVAAGSIASTRILMQSIGAFDRPVRLLTSEWFTFPMLSLRGCGDVEREELLTLPQLFVELIDSAISANTVHFQVYTYNEFYRAALREAAGALLRVFPGLAGVALRRLAAVFGYLHSDDSSRLEATLLQDSRRTLLVRGVANQTAPCIARKAVWKLLRAFSAAGWLPVPPALTLHPPGASVHFGGSFPMSNNPGSLETDVLGRIPGLQRIHLADASVFPSITASTITFSIMANARRIAAASAGL